MGNTSSNDANGNYFDPQAIADLKSGYPNIKMTDAQAKNFQVKRIAWFKGTIAISVVYGVLALAMLLIIMFSQAGKMALTGSLLPFTVTFIAGVVLIVILLIIQVTTFKPPNETSDSYDGDMCPDYWLLQKTDKSELDRISDPTNKFLMTYKCVPNKNIYGQNVKKNDGTKFSASSTTDSDVNIYGQKYDVAKDTYFKKYSTPSDTKTPDYILGSLVGPALNDNLSGPTADNANMQINCSKMFPNYIAMQDTKLFPDTPNALRCAYAKQCNIPWTSACPTNS